MAGDHGLIGGLRDDDHPQYYNYARLSSWYGSQPPNAHTHVVADITDIGTYYSAVGHSHVEADITDLKSYALSTHNHDGVYAPTHSHPYASDTHNHDGVYAPTHSHPYASSTHLHTGVYAPNSHSHSYLPLSGGTLTNTLYGTVISLSNEIQLPGNGYGSVSDPVLALGDGDTGIWEPADDVLEITAWSLARLIVDARSSYRGVFVVNSGFGVGLSGTLLSNNVIYNTPPTTSGSAKNAHWGLASGSIYYLMRDTSSRRYKRDIESWVPDFELEDLNVVQFTGSKATPVHDGSGVPVRGDDGEPLWEREWDDHLSYGLVAEEAYEVHPGLVTYDDDGAPDGIVWDLVTVRMIKELVALKREVAELRRAA